jgi:hypothetical protein
MDYKPHEKGRAHAFQVPANFRDPNATAVQIVDIGGIPHLWDPKDGVLCNLEACSEKIDPADFKSRRV